MFDYIIDAISDLFDLIGEVISFVVDGILSFFSLVVDYFKGLSLRKGHDIPFIADANKLANIIHQAPVKDVGIFEGTYNEDTDEIENYRMVEADELDSETKKILGDEKLVVLT